MSGLTVLYGTVEVHIKVNCPLIWIFTLQELWLFISDLNYDCSSVKNTTHSSPRDHMQYKASGVQKQQW